MLLMTGVSTKIEKPEHYLGDEEIVKNEKVVHSILRKPFKFIEFSEELKKIEKSLNRT
jgi:hypothetical protein